MRKLKEQNDELKRKAERLQSEYDEQSVQNLKMNDMLKN